MLTSSKQKGDSWSWIGWARFSCQRKTSGKQIRQSWSERNSNVARTRVRKSEWMDLSNILCEKPELRSLVRCTLNVFWACKKFPEAQHCFSVNCRGLLRGSTQIRAQLCTEEFFIPKWKIFICSVPCFWRTGGRENWNVKEGGGTFFDANGFEIQRGIIQCNFVPKQLLRRPRKSFKLVCVGSFWPQKSHRIFLGWRAILCWRWF